jgi:hypothetical protein
MTRAEKVSIIGLIAIATICMAIWLAYFTSNPSQDQHWPQVCRVIQPEDLDRQ